MAATPVVYGLIPAVCPPALRFIPKRFGGSALGTSSKTSPSSSAHDPWTWTVREKRWACNIWILMKQILMKYYLYFNEAKCMCVSWILRLCNYSQAVSILVPCAYSAFGPTVSSLKPSRLPVPLRAACIPLLIFSIHSWLSLLGPHVICLSLFLFSNILFIFWGLCFCENFAFGVCLSFFEFLLKSQCRQEVSGYVWKR